MLVLTEGLLHTLYPALDLHDKINYLKDLDSRANGIPITLKFWRYSLPLSFTKKLSCESISIVVDESNSQILLLSLPIILPKLIICYRERYLNFQVLNSTWKLGLVEL